MTIQSSNLPEFNFKSFIECYGSPNNQVLPKDGELARKENILPRSLIDFWQEYGFGSYADGLIWTHPPSIFDDLIEEWTGLLPNESSLIFRTSFGDFCFWMQSRAYLLDVHAGSVDELTGDINLLFDYVLCREQFLRDVLRSSQHSQSVGYLGKLMSDECFTFIPALALGGSETTDHVQKVKLRENLALLSQISGPILMR